MARKRIDADCVCERCGSKAPIDEWLSNDYWAIYKRNVVCHCGGEYKPRMLVNCKELTPRQRKKLARGQTARGGVIFRTQQKFEISTKNQKQATKSPKKNYKIK